MAQGISLTATAMEVSRGRRVMDEKVLTKKRGIELLLHAEYNKSTAFSAEERDVLELRGLRIMFLGAGSAATGIADLATNALMHEGLSDTEAHRRMWFLDINGLAVESRTDLMPHNLPYAHAHRHLGFVDAIREVRPQVLIGAPGMRGAFPRQALEAMAEINDFPTIFALSKASGLSPSPWGRVVSPIRCCSPQRARWPTKSIGMT